MDYSVIYEMFRQREKYGGEKYTPITETENYIIGNGTVYFIKKIYDKLNIKDMQEISESKESNHFIVCYNEITPICNKNFKDEKISHLSKKIELFSFLAFTHVPTNHYLTPEHFRVISEQEIQDVKKHSVDLRRLPSLLSSDPIVKFLGFPIGSIIRVHRKNEPYCYRLVVG